MKWPFRAKRLIASAVVVFRCHSFAMREGIISATGDECNWQSGGKTFSRLSSRWNRPGIIRGWFVNARRTIESLGESCGWIVSFLLILRTFLSVIYRYNGEGSLKSSLVSSPEVALVKALFSGKSFCSDGLMELACFWITFMMSSANSVNGNFPKSNGLYALGRILTRKN